MTSLRGQATDRARGFADDGKGRVTGLLENVSEVINDAARSVDRTARRGLWRLCPSRRRRRRRLRRHASATRASTTSVDDTRDFVRKSPAIAIGIAAVAGFALIRRDQDRPRRCRRPPAAATGPELGRAGRRSPRRIDRRPVRPPGRGRPRLMPRPSSRSSRRSPNIAPLRARRALVALAAGWFLLVSSMTALMIGAVTGLVAAYEPVPRRPAVGVPMAAGGYVLVSYGWSRDQGPRPRQGRAARRSTQGAQP